MLMLTEKKYYTLLYQFFLLTSLNLLFSIAQAAIVTKDVEYTADGVVMRGYLAYDDSQKIARPGVLIIHDQMGLTHFEKEKAKQLAAEGYAAFAADVYGKGLEPKNRGDAEKLAAKYKEDRSLFRTYIPAAYNKFSKMKQVDAKRIMVLGYSMGGVGALEFARTGAPIIGTAIFHSPLSNPAPQDSKKIRAPLLVMHGQEDPQVPPDEVDSFKNEMKNAKVNLNFIAYPETLHGFTEPDSGTDGDMGAAYNAESDKKSWIDFKKFAENTIKSDSTLNELALPESKCQRVPQFTDYLVLQKDVYTEELKKVNFNNIPKNTNLKIKAVKSELKTAEKTKANFAGKYIVTEWSCGNNCQEHAIIDAKTGKIIILGFQTEDGIEYDINSRLLIVNPMNVDVEPIKYYSLDNNKLKPICLQH